MAGYVYISYAHSDRNRYVDSYVDTLAQFLTEAGIPVWYDRTAPACLVYSPVCRVGDSRGEWGDWPAWRVEQRFDFNVPMRTGVAGSAVLDDLKASEVD